MPRLIAIAFLISSALVTVPSSAAACPIENGVYNVYLSNTVNAIKDGCSPLTAMNSLSDINTKLMSDRPEATVFVNIDAGSGIYVTNSVQWRFFNTDHPTYFLPYGVQNPLTFQGSRWPGQLRPIFRPLGSTGGYFLWFEPGVTADTPTNLYLMGLQVEGFAKGGIGFKGSDDRKHRVMNNTVNNMVFKNIGTKHQPLGALGMGAISFATASNNTVSYTTFENIENVVCATQCTPDAHIHSVYTLWNSDNNTISETTHTNVSGDPIRVRDGSDDNRVEYSLFVNAGAKAAISDWLNAGVSTCSIGGVVSTGECPSFRNVFSNNEVQRRYNSTTLARLECVNHKNDRSSATGPEGCMDSAPGRINASTGNTQRHPPAQASN